MPLLLNLIPVTYPEGLRRPGKRFSDPKERQKYQEQCRQDLFDAYIKGRLEQHHDRRGYKAEETKRWLIWLAKTLKEQKQTEFIIEKMQPDCLKQPKQKLLYRLSVGLIFGFIIAAIFEIWIILLRHNGQILEVVLVGILGGLLSGFQEEIEPIERWEFSWQKIWTGLTSVLIRIMRVLFSIELFAGLVTVIYYWINRQLTTSIFILLIILLATLLVFALIPTLAFGLIYGLGIGLGERDIPKEKRKKSNQGIWQSQKNVVWFALIGILSLSPIFIPIGWMLGRQIDFLVTTVIFGLTVGLFPGLACIQHFVLRRILWRSGSIPWNYDHFLRYAADRRFIQPVGGRYRFIHDLLREHFAEMG